MNKGYVYILTNPSMPGLVKIGKTTRDPEGRARALYRTGVPTPFRVLESVWCKDCGATERHLHKQLAPRRVSDTREFFDFREEVEHAALVFRIYATFFNEGITR